MTMSILLINNVVKNLKMKSASREELYN